MQNADVIIKVVIPMMILIFWAISGVVNREKCQKAARERATSYGQRLSPYQQARPPQRPAPPPPTPRYVPPAQDDVLVIRGEPSRPPSRQPQPQKRNNRQRSGSGRRGQEPSPSRNRDLVGGNLAADVNQSLTKPLEIRPLAETMAMSPSASGTAATVVDAPTTAVADRFRGVLTDPARIREAFILNEILQPPVSLRKR